MGLKMLTREDCGGCAEMKEALADPIAKGEISVVDVKSEEGQKAVSVLKVEYVPTIYFDDNGTYHRCEIKQRDGAVDVECSSEPEGSSPQ